MNFTAKEIFRLGYFTAEPGNTYDSHVHGLADADVERAYESGWCDIEGRDPAPERVPGAKRISVTKAQHGNQTTGA